jgi:hypothetical protein
MSIAASTGTISGFRGKNGDMNGRSDTKLPVPKEKTERCWPPMRAGHTFPPAGPTWRPSRRRSAQMRQPTCRRLRSGRGESHGQAHRTGVWCHAHAEHRSPLPHMTPFDRSPQFDKKGAPAPFPVRPTRHLSNRLPQRHRVDDHLHRALDAGLAEDEHELVDALRHQRPRVHGLQDVDAVFFQ